MRPFGVRFRSKPFPVGALLPFDCPHQFRPRFGSTFDTIVAAFSLYVLTFIYHFLDCPEPPQNAYSSIYKADFTSRENSFGRQFSVSFLVSFSEGFPNVFFVVFIWAPILSPWHRCSFSFGCPLFDRFLELIENYFVTKEDIVFDRLLIQLLLHVRSMFCHFCLIS